MINHNCQNFLFSQWSSSFGKVAPHGSFEFVFCMGIPVWRSERKDLYQGLDSSLPLFPQQWQPKVKKGYSWSLQQHIVRYHFRLFFPDLEFYISEPNSLRVSFLQGRPFETTETLSFHVYFSSLSSFLNNPMLRDTSIVTTLFPI